MFTLDTLKNDDGTDYAQVISTEGAPKGLAVFPNKLLIVTRHADGVNGVNWEYQTRGRAGTSKIRYAPATTESIASIDSLTTWIKDNIPVTAMSSMACKFVYAPDNKTRGRLLGVRKPRTTFVHSEVRPQGKSWVVDELKAIGVTSAILNRMVGAGLLRTS